MKIKKTYFNSEWTCHALPFWVFSHHWGCIHQYFFWHFCCFLKWAVITEWKGTHFREARLLHCGLEPLHIWAALQDCSLHGWWQPYRHTAQHQSTGEPSGAHLGGGQSRVETWVTHWRVFSWCGSGDSSITLKLSMDVLFPPHFHHLWTQLQLQGAHGAARLPCGHRPPKYFICFSRKSTLD